MSKLFFVTDVESTGPDFARHNMYQFASVPVTADGVVLSGIAFDVDFSTKHHDPETLKFLKRDLGITLDTLRRRKNKVSPLFAMTEFDRFITRMLHETGAEKAIFVADNLAFDWGFMHTYFHRYLNKNPFGYAGRNIPCLSMGRYGKRNAWEAFITEAHTHDALEDTRGNAGAFAKMINDGLRV